MAKTRRMNAEQHKQAGKWLFKIRNHLLSLSTQLPYAKNHRASAKARRAVDAVDSLRAALDCQLSLDVGFDDFNPDTYYPGNGNGFEQSPKNGRMCYRCCGESETPNRNNALPLAGLRCTVDRIEYDFNTKSGCLHLPAGHCTDMSGAIALFKAIDPDVRRIETTAELSGDTTYECHDGEWVSLLGGGR